MVIFKARVLLVVIGPEKVEEPFYRKAYIVGDDGLARCGKVVVESREYAVDMLLIHEYSLAAGGNIIVSGILPRKVEVIEHSVGVLAVSAVVGVVREDLGSVVRALNARHEYGYVHLKLLGQSLYL